MVLPGLPGLADPEQLETLAARIEAEADEVRAQARLFRRQVEQVRWRSDGATRYQEYAAELATDVDGAAAALDEAAADLRRHAQAVRERIAWMADMVEDLQRRAEELWDDAQGAFEWGRDQAEGAWREVRSWF